MNLTPCIASALAVTFSLASIASTAHAAGDPVKGKAAFNQCVMCHKVDASGKSSIGPNLKGVVGRSAGTLAGFNYSPAMKAYKKPWTPQALDAFLTAPAKAVPGNKMPYAGLRNPVDRANVIAYMQSQK